MFSPSDWKRGWVGFPLQSARLFRHELEVIHTGVGINNTVHHVRGHSQDATIQCDRSTVLSGQTARSSQAERVLSCRCVALFMLTTTAPYLDSSFHVHDSIFPIRSAECRQKGKKRQEQNRQADEKKHTSIRLQTNNIRRQYHTVQGKKERGRKRAREDPFFF